PGAGLGQLPAPAGDPVQLVLLPGHVPGLGRAPDRVGLDHGKTPRTSLASATRLMPLIRAAVRMSTFSEMEIEYTSSNALVMISRRRATVSFSVQKYFWTS